MANNIKITPASALVEFSGSGAQNISINVASTGDVKFVGTTNTSLLTISDVNFSTTTFGTLITAASVTGHAGIRAPHGTAPTSPTNGDIWSTTSGLFAQINSATKTIAFTDSSITGSAATLTTGRTIGMSGDMSWTSASFNGSANVTGTGTLATVNGNLGTFGDANTVPVFTVNAKGLITAVSTSAIGSNGLSISAASGLQLTNGTSNIVSFNTSGVAAPAFTTRSAGTKIVLYPQLSSSNVDYAIGVEGNTIWQSIPDNTSSYFFKWYGGTTEVARLSGAGTLLVGTTSSDGVNKVQVNGGVATTGVKFPSTQVPSSDPNTLDDYVENGFTPVLTFGGGNTGLSYTSRVGVYTKVGRVVNVIGTIFVNAKGSSTGVAAVSLPVANGSAITSIARLALYGALKDNSSQEFQAYVLANSSTVDIYLVNNNAGVDIHQATDANFQDGAAIGYTVTYFT